MELVLGGVAAVGAGIFSNPLEVVKVRLQLQGELQSKGNYVIHYRNAFHAAYTIGVKDGFLALQKGLVPALWYQLVMNGTRLGIYQLGDKYGLIRNSKGDVHPFKSVIVAAIAGASGGAIASPLFLVKTQLQSRVNDMSIAVGHQHNQKNMTSAFRTIYKEFGVSGFWRGTSGSVIKMLIGSAVQLTAFSVSLDFIRGKKIFSEGSLLNPFCASMIAGLCVAFVTSPLDLVSTRVYNQGVGTNGKGILYASLSDCSIRIYKTEGIPGFFKGLTANYFRLGPHTMLVLVFWDQLKHYYRRYQTTNSG